MLAPVNDSFGVFINDMVVEFEEKGMEGLFTVVEWDGTHYWFRMREGRAQGVDYPLKLSKEQIEAISVGMNIRAELSPVNEERTYWSLDSYSEVPVTEFH